MKAVQHNSKDVCWLIGDRCHQNEENPLHRSYHFGQVPHLIFAVLNLPSAVVDLLKDRNTRVFICLLQEEARSALYMAHGNLILIKHRQPKVSKKLEH